MDRIVGSRQQIAAHGWRQTGRIWLWRYVENIRNYPGWHVTADAQGAASLLGLLGLLDTLNQGGADSARTVQISAPSASILAVPNNRRAAWHAPARLRVGTSANEEEWRLTAEDQSAALTVGSGWRPVLQLALVGIAEGRGDYAIGPSGKQQLTIWWCNADR